MKRHLLVAPRRTQYTITIESLSDQSTRVTVESVRQVYGVTMFTYPGWHDRKTTDSTEAVAILEAIETKTADA
jgi:hypothetical protein